MRIMQEQPARYCPRCGGALAPGPVEGRERLRCTTCDFVHYLNPASAVAAAVLDGRGRVLLIRRRIPPFQGQWALPAGYQEIDEDPRAAALREVREETGLAVEVTGLFDVLWVPDDCRKPANVIVYLCRPLPGPEPESEPERLVAGSDAEAVRWFELDGLPPEVGFGNAERILARLPRP